MLLAFTGYCIVTYFTVYKTPQSFRDSVEALKQRPDILNKIGQYESYSYYDEDLPTKEDNPARFKLSLKGSDATIYLSCVATKAKSGTWFLAQIKQDSLVKAK